MQVHAVRNLRRHDVHPAIGHRQFPARHVQLERVDERLEMPPQPALQPFERRRGLLHAMGRVVGGIATRIIALRPSHSRFIVQPQLQAFA
jgi:hypothetical protein